MRRSEDIDLDNNPVHMISIMFMDGEIATSTISDELTGGRSTYTRKQVYVQFFLASPTVSARDRLKLDRHCSSAAPQNLKAAK